MRNKLSDLNNILFELLEEINDEDIKGDAREKLMERAKASNDIGKNIIDIAKVEHDAFKTCLTYGNEKMIYNAPAMLGLVDEKTKRKNN